MISYGDMLDVVEEEEAKNAPPTSAPTVETPKETTKKEKNEDNIEDVIGEKEEE